MLERNIVEDIARQAFGPNAQITSTKINTSVTFVGTITVVEVYDPAPKSGQPYVVISARCLNAFWKCMVEPDDVSGLSSALVQAWTFIKEQIKRMELEIKALQAGLNLTSE